MTRSTWRGLMGRAAGLVSEVERHVMRKTVLFAALVCPTMLTAQTAGSETREMSRPRPGVYSVEPHVGAGFFSSYLNIDDAPITGVRGRLFREGGAWYVDLQLGFTNEHPLDECANEFCMQNQGPLTLVLANVGQAWDLMDSAPDQPLELELAVGVGFVRLIPHRENASGRRQRPAPAVAISASPSYALSDRVRVRLTVEDYVALVGKDHYDLALNHYAALRAGLELSF